MKQNDLRKHLYWISFVLFILFIFSPVCVKFLTDMWGETWLIFVRPLLISSAVVSVCFLVKHKVITLTILSIFMVTTICEWVMIRNYALYMEIDHFMAFATTNWEESTTFASNNLQALWYIIPMVLLFVATAICYVKSTLPSLRIRLITSLVCVVITIIGIMPFDGTSKISNLPTFKAAVFKNTLKTPPMNIFHLTKVTIRKIHRSMQTNDFAFNSTRTKKIEGKEIYILAIGESVRYANCSLNGIYPRETMPLLAKL